MDSVTQFVLGAGIGAAVLGPKIGPRKAALMGGVLGTVPDLDVLYPFDDPIDAFTLHRGPTHSVLVQAVVTPVFGEALVRLFSGLRNERIRTYLAVCTIFVTHAVLDALTIYGTRIFWPVWPEPLGAGYLFIIDPLYTLPLLVMTLWALFRGRWSARFGKAMKAVLLVTTLYLGWAAMAQQMAEARARSYLTERQIEPDLLLAIPTPFNTVFWKVLALSGDSYINLYVPLLAGAEEMTAFIHPRGSALRACIGDNPGFRQIARFSDGFYRLERAGDEIRITDLRMGLTPNYAFSFAISEPGPDGPEIIRQKREAPERGGDGDIDWLIAGITGTALPRQAEEGAALDMLDSSGGVADTGASLDEC